MKTIVEEIQEELCNRCEEFRKKDGYDFWNYHIKFVVQHAVELAEKYKADVEITKLGALLHDIAMPSEIGSKEEHHIYGAKIARELLQKFGYPEKRIEKVVRCVENHRGSINCKRETLEEQCVADADVMAHFDCIPDLFSLAYKNKGLDIKQGSEYVKHKLERDWNKLSIATKQVLKPRYEKIMEVLFVD